jgi:nucleotide-binding universal stress UspA family protein
MTTPHKAIRPGNDGAPAWVAALIADPRQWSVPTMAGRDRREWAARWRNLEPAPTSAHTDQTKCSIPKGDTVYNTIAWATDGSPSALNALTTATGLARQFGAKLAIIHVEEVFIGRGGIFVDPNDAVVAALHRTAQRLRDEGIETTVSVGRAPASKAAQTVIDLAAEAGADMIVVGNRGHGPLAGLVLGSVALQLLRTAPRPVVMVPSRIASESSSATADASLARA